MPASTSQPDAPAWDVDADWWGPTWDVVTSVVAAEPALSSRLASAATGEPTEQAIPVPAAPASGTPVPGTPVRATRVAATPVPRTAVPRTPVPGTPVPGSPVPASHGSAADPSWGRILATTIGLWVSRRSPGASRVRRSDLDDLAGLADPGKRRGAAGPRRGRFRAVGRASAAWRAHARLLSAAMLGVGLLAVGAGTAGLVLARASSPPSVRLTRVPAPSGRAVVPISLSAVQPQTPKPVWLTIPAIGVKAPIVTLGLNRNGTLQVPRTTTVVGWYTGSPRPGAVGSAIIAGHVDSRAGPGVFFWLRTMHRGERIYVRRADGTLAVFTVTAVQMYAKDDFPTAMVYGPVPDAELRLITCGGTFDYARGSYLSNVVVYARLSA
jgi:Sortase domain